MSEIDQLITYLLDKKWVDIAEVTDDLQLEYAKLERIVGLLAEFRFIQVKGQKIRVYADTKRLLESFKEGETQF